MADNHATIDGELWTKDDRIAYVGAAKPSDIVWNREIDARGNLIMPGFKNAHTHSAMTFLRSYADDLPLLDWLNKQVFPMEAKLTGDDVYRLCRLAIMEYLTSGVTANFDMYMFPDQLARASVDCGFRTVLCGGINDFVGDLPFLEDCYQKFNAYDPLIGFRLGFHAEYTTSRPLLEGISALAAKYAAPVYTHNSESRAEVEGCVARYGMTPTAFLDHLGMFAHGGGGYHCVHMTDNDIEILRRNNVSVVTNPGSNCKLASGIAPVQRMLDAGINVAIGTDGPASNNALDMFREMFLTTALQKISLDDASATDADTVLRMATAGGARAMGLTDCDVLAVGKCADLIMLDLHQPNMQPINNLTKNIVYSGSKQNVKLTMVAGRVRYEDGKFDIGVDPETVYAEANAIIERMR